MKKYLLLLLLFTSFWGYSQTTQAEVTTNAVDGARTVTFVNPSIINITNIIENNSSLPTANGKIEFIVSGGIPSTIDDPYTLSLKKGTTEVLTPINHSIELESANKYKVIITGLDAGTYTATIKDAICPKEKTETFTIYKTLNVIVSQTNIKCFGDSNGTINLAISGGSGEYTTQWNNVLSTNNRTQLPAGVYNYIITDKKATGNFAKDKANGMIAEGTITILAPTKGLTASLTKVKQPSPGLNDGVLDLEVDGGYENYSFVWKKDGATMQPQPTLNPSGNISGLGNGKYQVLITDKGTYTAEGCTIDSEIIELEALNLNIATPVPISCQGGTTNLIATASGGNGQIEFVWFELTDTNPVNGVELVKSSSLNDTKAGTYKVTATDSNHTVSQTIIIADSPNPIITAITSQTAVTCFNGSDGKANIKVSNAVANATYIFKWYKITNPQTLIEITDNITSTQAESTKSGLTEGSYTVTASNGFCTESFPITITSAPLIIVNEQSGGFKDLKCFGDNNGSIAISVSGGTGPYTYIWKRNGTPLVVNNVLNPSSLEAGTYSVEVHTNYDENNLNKCFSVLENIIISQPNLLEFNYTTTDITCKNSSDGTIQLNIKGGKFTNDGNGKPIYKISSNAQGLGAVIDIPNQKITGLSVGTWDVIVLDDNNCVIPTHKIKIDEPLMPFAFGNTKITNVTGNGLINGSIQISNTGGWENYSYKWYTGNTVNANTLIPNEESSLFEGKPAGIYTVVATDKNKDNLGCSLPPISFQIKQPEALMLNVIGTNTKCNDGKGSIIAIAEGGAEIEQQQSERIYTYELFLNTVSKQIIVGNTANFTGLGIGQYTVVAKDSKLNLSTIANTTYKNGVITSTSFVELTQPTPILVKEQTTGIKKTLHCYNDTDGILAVSVSGGTPFTTDNPYIYVWKKLNKLTSTYEEIEETASPFKDKLSEGTYSVEVRDANYDNTNPSACIGILENLIIIPAEELKFTYTKENASCYGESNGSIQLNITGGKAPYKIITNTGTVDNLNGTVSGLSVGTYTLKVIDENDCPSIEQKIEIGEPEKSVYIDSETVVITPATGFGLPTGKIAITAAGGTAPYNYTWENSSGTSVGTDSSILNNVIAGIYKVLITDSKGCQFLDNYTIEQPTKPTIAATPTQSKCNGLLGSLEAVAAGGAIFNQNQSERVYIYKLKNKTSGITTTISGNTASFSNIADGSYNLTATDVSGVDSDIIDLEFRQPTPIVVSLVSKSNVKCFGDQDGAIAISVSGGTPFMVDGNPKYNYQWKRKNKTNNNYENFTPKSLNAFTAGIYAVEVRDANYDAGNTAYCMIILENIEITQPDDFGFDIDKITYTNPTANGNDGKLHFEITGGKSNYEYKFYTKNAAGIETILNTVSNSEAKTVDFDGLIKDHYYISATDDTGCIKYTDFDFRDNPLIVSINQTQNITCNDANNGILTITTEGGFGAKTISWYFNNILLSTDVLTDVNLNLLNAKPGAYYAVIKDFNKVEVTSNEIIVTQPQRVIFSMTQEPVKCLGDSNGMVTVSASGGNGIFRYRYFSKNILIKDWTNFSNATTTTILNLAEGEYTIEVQDTQECTSQNAVIKVTSPTALRISNSVSVPATGKGLSNGSVSITAQGANGGYTYNWFKSDNTTINQITNTAVNLSAGKYYVIITDAKGCNLTSPLLEVTEPPLLETVIAVQNVILCNGDINGSIKPTTTGGFLKPGDVYSYRWYENGNPSVLATTTILNEIGIGSYYVIAVDSNGNEAKSQILFVTQPEILSNTLTSDYTLCGDANNWTIDANPSGGTAPYTYIWNNDVKTASLQNVPPGNYSVSVTDSHGCKITNNITITAPVHLAAAENIIIPTCYGGSDATIEVTSSGGKAPYTYLWNTGEKSNTLRNASAGVYSVTVRDSKGCIINHDYTIVNPPKDVISLGEDVTLCFDQTLTINAAIDDDKATYLWKSDKGFSSTKSMITISEPANYTVVVTNKLGCEATDTIKISSQNTAISAEFAMSSQVFKNEKIVIVDISNPIADEIEWILPANALIVNKNKDYAEISFSEAGQYEITLNTKKGDCTAFQTKQILVTEGEFEENNPDENDPEKKFDLKIYPNPSQGIFTVDVIMDKVMPAHVKVYNLNNNLLIDSKSQDGKDNYLFNFSLSGLPAGLYFVLFESQQGSKLRKIIIQ